MKYNRLLNIICLFGILFLFSCGPRDDNSKKLPPLIETYSKTDKNPFGGNVAHRVFKNALENNYVSDYKKSFAKLFYDQPTEDAVFFSISRQFYNSEEDVEKMLRFAANGGDLMLVSRNFDTTLLNIAGVTETRGNFLIDYMNIFDPVSMDTTEVSLSADMYRDTVLKEYFYYGFTRGFLLDSNSQAKVLSYNDRGMPNAIVKNHGSGRIFLHCDPRVFSNYYLLKGNNTRYLTELLAYTRDDRSYVYWDDYSWRLRSPQTDNSSRSGLGYLLSKPPLVWAFWLTLGMLLIYVLFGGKRRQRIVPERKPNINYSVNFVETVGRLYLQQKDNRNIADKMIQYFNEFVRNNYYLDTHKADEEFMDTLSRKSGVPFADVQRLYQSIKQAQTLYDVSDSQILSLNHHIQNFYKKLK